MTDTIDVPTLILYLGMTAFMVAAVYFFSVNGKSKNWSVRVQRRSLIVLLWAVMVFVAACRSPRVGTDTLGYIERFHEYRMNYRIEWRDFIRLNSMEPLYYYATALIHVLTDNYHFYFLVVYAVIAGGFCRILCDMYREYSAAIKGMSIFAYLPVALVMTYYIHSLSVLRNWLSIGIALWAFVFLAKDKYFKALLFIILSGLIHYTGFSLIAVWLYCLWGHKRKLAAKPKWIIACSAVFVIILLGSVALINRIMAGTRFSSYAARTSNLMSILPNSLVLIGSIIFSKEIVKQGNHGRLCVICIPLQAAFLTAGQFGASRINYYFAFQNLYLISMIYGCLHRRIRWKYAKYALRVLIVLFVMVICYRNFLMYANKSGIFPYEFIGFRAA